MNWFFGEHSGGTLPWVWAFRVANLISGVTLLLTPALLGYFLKKKERGASDPVIVIAISAIFFLGVKKLAMVIYQNSTDYPAYCTFIDVLTAIALLILIWLLPPLILKILTIVSRERLLQDLVRETHAKIIAQDSATSLEIKNAQLQSIIFRFETVLKIQHRSDNQGDTVAQLKEVISSSGGSHSGD